MREILGVKSFQQALIPMGLKMICKVSGGIYTPGGIGGGGVPVSGYKPGGLLTEQTGHIPDILSRAYT